MPRVFNGLAIFVCFVVLQGVECINYTSSMPRQHPLPLRSVLSSPVSPEEANRRNWSRDPLSARMLQKPATEVRLFRYITQSNEKYFLSRDL